MPSLQESEWQSLGLNPCSWLGCWARASWDRVQTPIELLEGCCTLTPLRFFRACICEGLGVVSGLAIWLQGKRKASFSELRDHLPGLD